MKFSPEEVKSAQKFGLELGSPYQEVQRTLKKNGWVVDRSWLDETGPNRKSKEDLVCGQGLDAECSTVYTKSNSSIELRFSGVNKGLPLIGVKE